MTEPRPSTVMARLRRPRSETRARLAVISDPHVPRRGIETKKLYKPETFLERAIADVNARSVNATLFLGDLTMDGFEEEYDRFDRIVDDLSGRWIAIPGNHDAPKSYDDHASPSVDEFARRYSSDGIPFSVGCGGVDVLGLDSASSGAVRDSHDGVVDSDDVEWLDRALAMVQTPIVAVHHAFPSTMAQFDEYRDDFDRDLGRPPVLRAPDRLIETLIEYGVSLVLTGHLHIPSIADLRSITEVNVPATCTFPPSYVLVDVGPRGTEVTYVPLGTTAEIQTAYERRREFKPKANALTAMASARLARFPLLDET